MSYDEDSHFHQVLSVIHISNHSSTAGILKQWVFKGHIYILHLVCEKLRLVSSSLFRSDTAAHDKLNK